MTVSLALVDYIPVVLFLISAIILQRDFYNKMSKGAFALFAAGSLMIFFAGFYKATWKLLFCAGLCDFEKLSQTFMPMQSTGYLLIAVSLLAMFFFPQGKGAAFSVAAPAVFSGTFLFIPMMCAGIGVLCAALSVLAAKLKKKGLIFLFVLSFVAMLAMGYLASQDFADPKMNWIAEGVNVLGQGTLLLGACRLHKAGLAELRLS